LDPENTPPREIWFKRMPGGTHLPATPEGLALFAKHFVLILLATGGGGWVVTTLFGKALGGLALGLIGGLGILNLSAEMDKRSEPLD
jgi:hypothetical protein